MKRRIKAILDEYPDKCYYFMPVPSGYGKQTLDYLGFVKGRGFAIEAKASDGKLTARQEVIRSQISESGVPVFVIKDEESLRGFEVWIGTLIDTTFGSPYYMGPNPRGKVELGPGSRVNKGG